MLHRLRDHGNAVVVIEHNLEVIKTADWILDLGPEGGENGGRLVVAGTPEQVAAHPTSHTGRFLASVLRTSTMSANKSSETTAREGGNNVCVDMRLGGL